MLFWCAETTVQEAFGMASSRCTLRTDLLGVGCGTGVYMEVEVVTNPDSVRIGLVHRPSRQCEWFDPGSGLVRIHSSEKRNRFYAKERIPSLRTQGRGFEGFMGVYIREGRIAFFRRQAELGPWETTGFVSDLSWVDGERLTLFVRFGEEGIYHVRMACVNRAQDTY